MSNKDRQPGVFSRIALHPFMIAAYAVLALLGHNIEEIKLSVGLRSLLASMLAGMIIYLLARWITRDNRRAALVATVILALFYSYGQVYGYLKDTQVLGGMLGRHRVLGPLWLLFLIAGIWWVTRPRRDLANLTLAFNAIAGFLLIFPLLQIGSFEASAIAASNQHSKPSAAVQLQLPPGKTAPDIYYIILDGYSRDDLLRDYYGLDNTAFLQKLQNLGFFIARCSQSNYAQTQLSLSSSLNFNYLPDLGSQYTGGNTSTSRVGLSELIHHNALRSSLQVLGYKSVAFETGFKGTQWEDADLYLSPEGGAIEKAQFFGGVSDFEVLFMRTTAGLIVMDTASALPKSIQKNLNNPRETHRALILYDLDELKKMPSIPGPKLVFAHMVIPHRPFVFGPHGEEVDPNKADIPGYRDQVTFINNQMLPIFQELITQSATPPIIIVQGDHGGVDTSPIMRMRNLNAYYLPDGGESLLYPQITPINSFRVVLDRYFGAHLDMLEDRSYFSDYQAPYEYKEIPNTRQDCSRNY